jgi:hypothetical protein
LPSIKGEGRYQEIKNKAAEKNKGTRETFLPPNMLSIGGKKRQIANGTAIEIIVNIIL